MNQKTPESAPDARDTDEAHRLATRFARVSERLHRDMSEPVTYQRVVDGAVEAVPGCDESGVLMRGRRGTLMPVAQTSSALAGVDESQCLMSEGPCFEPDFASVHRPEHDLSVGGRWPSWSPVATRHGMRSVLALPLHVGNQELGALTMYGREHHAFDERSVALATIYAAHASQALEQLRTITGLRTALESRHDIGVAQGVLAVRYDLSYEEAFSVLQRYSSHSNTKVRDLAQRVKVLRSLPVASE